MTNNSWSDVEAGSDHVSLTALRCGACQRLTFPPTAERCPHCWSSSTAREDVPGHGTLYSFTVVHRSFPGWEVPYVVGEVDLDSGLRVMSRVSTDNVQALKVGLPVFAVRAENEREGRPATAYEFRIKD